MENGLPLVKHRNAAFSQRKLFRVRNDDADEAGYDDDSHDVSYDYDYDGDDMVMVRPRTTLVMIMMMTMMMMWW